MLSQGFRVRNPMAGLTIVNYLKGALVVFDNCLDYVLLLFWFLSLFSFLLLLVEVYIQVLLTSRWWDFWFLNWVTVCVLLTSIVVISIRLFFYSLFFCLSVCRGLQLFWEKRKEGTWSPCCCIFEACICRKQAILGWWL